MLGCIVYLAIGAVFYTNVEGWSVVTAVYFSMVTMSTVGYGDFAPSTVGGKAFTSLWILIGIVFVFAAIASAVGVMVAPLMKRGRATLERWFPSPMIDIDGDGDATFRVPRHPFVEYAKGMLPSLVLCIVLQMIGAAGFRHFEGWGFGDAVWHVFVTATTVGYGDQTIASDAGKIWACVHIMMCTALLGEIVGSIGDLQSERATALQRLELLQRPLTEQCVTQVRQHVCGLRPAAAQGESGVTELEWVLGKLAELGLVDVGRQVRPFVKQFRLIDADSSGRVDDEDVRLALASTAGAAAAAGTEQRAGSQAVHPQRQAPLEPELDQVQSIAKGAQGAATATAAATATTVIPVLCASDFDEYLAAQAPKLARGAAVFAHFVASVSPVTGHS